MALSPEELKERTKGLVHLVMTPFDENEEINKKALRKSVRHTVEKLRGEKVVFLSNGSTGEFYAMNDEENREVAQIVVEEIDGEFPVIVGTGRAGTKPTIEMSQYAQEVGADGVMVVLPYYHLATNEGIYRHYQRIAQNLDIGVMVYNNPVTSKMWIPPDLMVRLSKIENIVIDKENTLNMGTYYALQRAINPEDMIIICGAGQLAFQFEALYACPAYVTELANYAPKMAIEFAKAGVEKDFDKLVELANKIAPYHEFRGKLVQKRGSLPTVLSPQITTSDLPLYQGVCKAAMDLVGVPGGGRTRDPMENITPEEKLELKAILQEIGIL